MLYQVVIMSVVWRYLIEVFDRNVFMIFLIFKCKQVIDTWNTKFKFFYQSELMSIYAKVSHNGREEQNSFNSFMHC